jgi:hypothetical protein
LKDGSDRLEEILCAGDIDFAASTIPVQGDSNGSVRREPLMVLLPARQFAARKALTNGGRTRRFQASVGSVVSSGADNSY